MAMAGTGMTRLAGKCGRLVFAYQADRIGGPSAPNPCLLFPGPTYQDLPSGTDLLLPETVDLPVSEDTELLAFGWCELKVQVVRPRLRRLRR